MSKTYVVIVEWDDCKESGIDAGWDGPYETLYHAQIDYPLGPDDGSNMRYVGKMVRGADNE